MLRGEERKALPEFVSARQPCPGSPLDGGQVFAFPLLGLSYYRDKMVFLQYYLFSQGLVAKLNHNSMDAILTPCCSGFSRGGGAKVAMGPFVCLLRKAL